MPRYTLTGLPPEGALGVSAFFPHYVRLAGSGAQEYKDGVSGYPGTKAIPVFSPDSVPSPDLGDIAQMGLSRSSDAPDLFWPNLYYVRPEGNYWPGLLIQMYDPTAPELTTHIPVPAVSLRQHWLRDSAALAMGIRGPSVKQIRQPVSQLVNWLSRRSGNGLPSG